MLETHSSTVLLCAPTTRHTYNHLHRSVLQCPCDFDVLAMYSNVRRHHGDLPALGFENEDGEGALPRAAAHPQLVSLFFTQFTAASWCSSTSSHCQSLGEGPQSRKSKIPRVMSLLGTEE
jgi:hypothetical protein